LSSAELSVEIYHLVTRAVGGEPIDVATRSEELAARYPQLGLSAPLIGKAIARAAAMVGVALDSIGEAPHTLTDAPHAQPAVNNVNGFHPSDAAMPATRSPLVPTSRSSTDAETSAPGASTTGTSASESGAPAEPDSDAALRRIFIRE
jgi:hypothetical protein